METNILLDELVSISEGLNKQIIALKEFSIEDLNNRNDINSWSALECIEHLNLYYNFYVPEISKRMAENKAIKSKATFSPGWIGNYFANTIKVKDRKVNKMKTFRDKNPIGSKLNYETLDLFLEYQSQIIQLLNEARQLNLNKVKTSITISKLIKLKLGDTFRFLIYHNERHVIQAINTLNSNI